MSKTKILIAGSRGITNSEVVKKAIADAIAEFEDEDFMLVSGGAKGVDTIAEEYARENNKPMLVVKPNYTKYFHNPKIAPRKRNESMVRMADKAIIIWDGKSNGTRHAIDLVKEKGIQYSIIMDIE